MALKLPDGSPLALPRMGDHVWVAFPNRGWNCPGVVVTPPDPRGLNGALDVLVFNKHTAFQHAHLKRAIPHTAFGSGEEPVWRWPV